MSFETSSKGILIMATEIFKHDGRQVFGSDFGSVVKGVDSDNRTITLIASDESIDRDGDIISAKGWELKNYLKNPIFLWVHQYSIVPLSRCLKIFSTKNPPVWTHKFTPPLASLL